MNDELQKLALQIQTNLRDIVDNPKHKRETHRKKLMIASWHSVFQAAMNRETNEYKRLILYSIDNMVTFRHAEYFTSDTLYFYIIKISNLIDNWSMLYSESTGIDDKK